MSIFYKYGLAHGKINDTAALFSQIDDKILIILNNVLS